jgi:hypothetical protein
MSDSLSHAASSANAAPSSESGYQIPVGRNVAEYIAIVGWWGALLALHSAGRVSAGTMTALVLAGCVAKSVLFGAENMQQLRIAAQMNLAHHRFLLMMAINMSQMVLAFTFDFHLLHLINAKSFTGIAPGAGLAEMLFDFFYLSTLNFSFFGYSDVLPQTVPSRIVNLTEIVLAFFTVIFMLSDFISLKESLRAGDQVTPSAPQDP